MMQNGAEMNSLAKHQLYADSLTMTFECSLWRVDRKNSTFIIQYAYC